MSRIGEYIMAIITKENDDLPEPRGALEREFYEAAKEGLCDHDGSGGVSSWNDLTDKPFGEIIETTETDTLAWDGDTTGLYSVIDEAYLVSDAVPTLEELQQGGTITSNVEGMEEETFGADGEDSISAIAEDIIQLGENGMVLIVLKDGAVFEDGGITFEKAGIYFYKSTEDAGGYITSLAINGYTFTTTTTTVKQLDEKYYNQPNRDGYFIEESSDTLTWDFDLSGRTQYVYSDENASTGDYKVTWVHISDVLPTLAELRQGGTVNKYLLGTIDSAEFTADDISVAEADLELGEAIVKKGNVVIGSPTLQGAFFIYYPDDTIFTKKGVWLVISSTEKDGIAWAYESITVNGFTGFSKCRLAQPFDTAVKTVAGVEPDVFGNVDMSTVVTEAVEAAESSTNRYTDITVTETTDDDGNVSYSTDVEPADMRTLLEYHNVRLKFGNEIYTLAYNTKAVSGAWTSIFANTYITDSGVKTSQFRWTRERIDGSLTYTLTHTEKTIAIAEE